MNICWILWKIEYYFFISMLWSKKTIFLSWKYFFKDHLVKWHSTFTQNSTTILYLAYKIKTIRLKQTTDHHEDQHHKGYYDSVYWRLQWSQVLVLSWTPKSACTTWTNRSRSTYGHGRNPHHGTPGAVDACASWHAEIKVKWFILL